jgi:signal transduction histidine kinase
MDRRRPSRAAFAIAAALVLAALAALVALPLFVSVRTARIRASVEQRAQPARDDLNRVNYELSREIASISRLALTGESTHIEEYREAVAAQDGAMQSLRARVRLLGPEAIARYEELSGQLRRWRAGIDGYLEARRPSPPSAAADVAYETDYPAVIDAVSRLDDAISSFQSAERAKVAKWSQRQLVISVVIVIVALIAASIVLWMVIRLRTLTADLAAESEERRHALEAERESRQTAESLVRSRDEILGIVSHDLRSPLTTITLSTQLMEGAPAEERAEHIATILATTRRMQRLIQDLLDVSKLESGALSIRHDEIDPVSVANEVVASQAPIADGRGIRVTSSIASPLPKISGDHDRLVQALGNLIGNAIKFTPENGSIWFDVRSADDTVRFIVEDNGPGIAASDLPHLFEPFWQSKKTAHLGAGLGLKITRAIAEAHGGSIHVTNGRTGGACFTLEIPAGANAS